MMKPMTTQEQSDLKKGKKVKQMQVEIDETVRIMNLNVEKILERGEKLSDLEQRADGLSSNSINFNRGVEEIRSRQKKEMWMKGSIATLAGAAAIFGLICLF